MQTLGGQRSSAVRVVCLLLAGLVGTAMLSGCLVAGYSSNGGGFIWPGGFGLILVVLLVIFLLRRRR